MVLGGVSPRGGYIFAFFWWPGQNICPLPPQIVYVTLILWFVSVPVLGARVVSISLAAMPKLSRARERHMCTRTHSPTCTHTHTHAHTYAHMSWSFGDTSEQLVG